METKPTVYSPQDAPQEVLDLAAQLIPQLLAGDHPTLAVLRAQFERAQVSRVEMDGSGFFVNYEVPDDAPRAVPAYIAGGDAEIELAGAKAPAGCVLFVQEGRISLLDLYTYGEGWPEHAKVLSIKNVFPLYIR